MLSQLPAHATVAVKDLEAAKKFYEGTLGFTPAKDTAAGTMYQAGDGTQFLVFPTPSAGTAQNTVLGFTTSDLKSEVADLKAKGVKFEEYDYPTLKTEDAIATTPVGWSAWFKDPDGNTIGIVQFK